MNIYLFDQGTNFHKHLKRLKGVPIISYVQHFLAEQETRIEIQINCLFSEIDVDFLFSYCIFPEQIMTHLTQWSHEGRRMRVGDTIVQQIFIPPMRIFSQKIICGVRIKEIIDEPKTKGFSYETLTGHVEKGISTFTIEESGHGIFFVIKTYSAPANFLSKLVAPIFSRPYQAYCTKQALLHVKRRIELC